MEPSTKKKITLMTCRFPYSATPYGPKTQHVAAKTADQGSHTRRPPREPVRRALPPSLPPPARRRRRRPEAQRRMGQALRRVKPPPPAPSPPARPPPPPPPRSPVAAAGGTPLDRPGAPSNNGKEASESPGFFPIGSSLLGRDVTAAPCYWTSDFA